METKILSINITPEYSNQENSQNAGVMWEHNATALVFQIDPSYIGEYKYYLEYRSVIGTKVRTEYLALDTETNTVTYNIPVEMTSLRGVECYFNIVFVDEDGNTKQVIKPHKFYLEFEPSPDTDNSISKVNDFSINALMEAIRLGTFKGDKGDTGEQGQKGEKGDKGDQGEIPMDMVNTAFANAIKKQVQGNVIKIDDISPIEHTLKVNVDNPNTTLYTSGKNLWNKGDITAIKNVAAVLDFELQAGKTYVISADVTSTDTDTDNCLIYDHDNGVALGYITRGQRQNLTFNPKGNTSTLGFYASDRMDNSVGDTAIFTNIQIEIGDVATEYEQNQSNLYTANENGVFENVKSKYPIMCMLTNDAAATITAEYNLDTKKYVDNSGNYRVLTDVTLTEDVASVTIDKDLDGNPLNVKKVYIDFSGEIDTDASDKKKFLSVLLNKTEWLSYRGITTTGLGYWYCEGERKIKMDDKEIWISTQPTSTLYNPSTAGQSLVTQRCEMNTKNKSDITFEVRAASGATYANFKAGSRIVILGVEDND